MHIQVPKQSDTEDVFRRQVCQALAKLSSLPVVEATEDHSELDNLAYADSGHTGFEPTVTKGNLTAGSSKITIGGTGANALIGPGASVDLSANILQYTKRGNLEDWDWDQGDLTTDGTWYELDCSSIVPTGTVLIFFYLILTDNLVNQVFIMKHPDHEDNYSAVGFATQTANSGMRGVVPVPCDSNRKIKYYGSNTTFTSIDLTIVGWIKEV